MADCRESARACFVCVAGMFVAVPLASAGGPPVELAAEYFDGDLPVSGSNKWFFDGYEVAGSGGFGVSHIGNFGNPGATLNYIVSADLNPLVPSVYTVASTKGGPQGVYRPFQSGGITGVELVIDARAKFDGGNIARIDLVLQQGPWDYLLPLGIDASGEEWTTYEASAFDLRRGDFVRLGESGPVFPDLSPDGGTFQVGFAITAFGEPARDRFEVLIDNYELAIFTPSPGAASVLATATVWAGRRRRPGV